MKLLIKWIIIILTILIFLYAFSTSYYSQNIDHLDYVIALGIDSIPNSNYSKISFEFANLGSFSENASSTKTEPIINTIVAPSISNAISIMNAYLGKQLNMSHCKVIAFSKEYASKGIINDVSVLTHNIQVRPTTNIVVSEGEAVDYLKKSTSSLEQVITKYYSIFPTSSEYTGYTSNIPLGLFYENILDNDIGAVAILGKQVNSENEKIEEHLHTLTDTTENYSNYQSFDPNQVIAEGDFGTENIGLAVFKDDKYIGELSTIETLCYSLLKNEVDNFLITIDSPFDKKQKLDIIVESLSEARVNLDISDSHPIINIKMNLSGNILNILDISNTNYDDAIEQANIKLKEYLTKEFSDYLYKTSTKFNSDINGFYKLAKQKFLTISDFKNYNWAKKYENAEFNIEFNDNIISNILIKQN